MVVHDEKGFISKSFCISLGLHCSLMTALVVASYKMDPPVIEDSGVIEMSAVAPAPVEITVPDAPKVPVRKVIEEKKKSPTKIVEIKESSPEVKYKPAPVKKASSQKTVKKARVQEPITAAEVKEHFPEESDVQVAPVQGKELVTESDSQLKKIEEKNQPKETEASIAEELKQLDEETQAEEATQVAEELAQEEKSAVAPAEVEAPKNESKVATQNTRSSLSRGNPSSTARTAVPQDGRLLKQIAGNPSPKYPELSRRKRESGTVVLGYYVSSSGSVRSMKVIKSSGYPRLDSEAVRTVSRWKFVPGQEGKTVHPITYNLSGVEQMSPSRLRTSKGRKGTKNF